ncbi:MAG TPA: acyl-protein synthetase [Desulfocapsa sulfexigens]|nr:acyl-protein synthetase [Desulfocapsa sulfexigens]
MEHVAMPLSEYTYEQKLDLLETLWDELVRDDKIFESPDWHEEILKDREQALTSGKIKVSDWEEAKERIKRNASCG